MTKTPETAAHDATYKESHFGSCSLRFWCVCVCVENILPPLTRFEKSPKTSAPQVKVTPLVSMKSPGAKFNDPEKVSGKEFPEWENMLVV